MMKRRDRALLSFLLRAILSLQCTCNSMPLMKANATTAPATVVAVAK